ncbi:MAG: A/G-specific adenine glycosylase [Treponema sp.]|jgi:A/G-specific adenine glycosylase|nr:A/G-specific adenine glycosylase [Treponema sp.]
MKIGEFRKMVFSNYRQAGRQFPWRGAGPWGVMVSEFMLQQTQTERVLRYWENWMRQWPQPEDLAKAPMEEALRHWSGLGYNRRCYNLKNSAAIITAENNGKVPETPQALRLLPGIGPYIAGAIACFAYNYPAVFIETNIRATVIHCFFPDKNDVKDSEIYPILESALYKKDPRTWYYALMDYGASLKKLTENPNRRSAHYSRQSPFIGSFRQARGKVIKALASLGASNAEELGIACCLEDEKLYRVLERLEKESLVAEKGGIYRIRND